MWKLFSNNKSIEELQNDFFFSLEKIVNIAIVKTKRNDNQSVKEILNDLEQIFMKFWMLRKKNPDKFKTLLWSKDFLENYIYPIEKGLVLDKEDIENSKSAKELKYEASILLSFSPESTLRGLTQFLGSFEKIWKCAFQNDNDEISRYVVYHLNELLAELSCEKSNDLFIEQFLRLLNSITWQVVNVSNKEIDSSIHAASIYWYTHIVFNRLNQEGDFEVSYLPLFDKYFFSSVRYIISQEQTQLFEVLISSLVDDVHIPTYSSGKIWEYGHLLLNSNIEKYNHLDEEHKLSDRTKELAKSEKDIDTQEKLESWLQKFDELKAVLQPHFTKDQIKKAEELENEIREFVTSMYKYNNLLEIIFAIGAFCVFKNNPEYIKLIWEYKQPSDSDALHRGTDITPSGINDVIYLYFRKGLFERRFPFWEGHHGSSLYCKKYFLILSARALHGVQKNTEGKYEQIENYTLPDLLIHRLSDVEYSVEGLIKIANELKNETTLLGKLGFDTTQIKEDFDNKLILLLETLKTKAQEKIKDIQKTKTISPEKITEFKEEVVKSFYENIALRDIFKHYGLYEDKTNEDYKSDKERLGINIVNNKAAFFDEWHVHYAGWGQNYGKDLASGSDIYLAERIAENCKEIKTDNIEKILEKFSDVSEVIILTTNVPLYRFFEKSKKFKPNWYEDTKQLKVHGFMGWYVYKDEEIPIFKILKRKSNKQILLLNKSKMGKLIQYSPLNEGEDPNLKEDIFYMGIKEISKDEELVKNFLEKPPDWLKKIGKKKQQKEHLNELVIVHIFERCEYNMGEGFEGYIFRFND